MPAVPSSHRPALTRLCLTFTALHLAALSACNSPESAGEPLLASATLADACQSVAIASDWTWVAQSPWAGGNLYYLNGNFDAAGNPLVGALATIDGWGGGPVAFDKTTGAVLRAFDNGNDGAKSALQLGNRIVFTGDDRQGVRSIDASTWSGPSAYLGGVWGGATESITSDGNERVFANSDDAPGRVRSFSFAADFAANTSAGYQRILWQAEIGGRVRGVSHYDHGNGAAFVYASPGAGNGGPRVVKAIAAATGSATDVTRDDGVALEVPGSEPIYQAVVGPGPAGSTVLAVSTPDRIYLWAMTSPTSVCGAPVSLVGAPDRTGFYGLGLRDGSLYAIMGAKLGKIALTSGAVCGDGVVTAPEECDDGNTSDGDGCDSGCRVGARLCSDLVGQSDCPAQEACDIASESPPVLACRAVTTPGQPGQTCASATECARGVRCQGFVDVSAFACFAFCDDESDCAGFGSSCRPTGIESASYCTLSCQPETQTGCPADWTCAPVYAQGGGYTDCIPPEASGAPEGGSCAGTRDCSKGLTCTGAFECARSCVVDTGVGCAQQETCVAYEPALVVDGVAYGVCR